MLSSVWLLIGFMTSCRAGEHEVWFWDTDLDFLYEAQRLRFMIPM